MSHVSVIYPIREVFRRITFVALGSKSPNSWSYLVFWPFWDHFPASTEVHVWFPRCVKWILLPISSLDVRFTQQLCQLATIHPPSKTTDITGQWSGGVKTGRHPQLHLSTPEHLQAECPFHGPKRSAEVHYQPTLSCSPGIASSAIFQKKSLRAINNWWLCSHCSAQWLPFFQEIDFRRTSVQPWKWKRFEGVFPTFEGHFLNHLLWPWSLRCEHIVVPLTSGMLWITFTSLQYIIFYRKIIISRFLLNVEKQNSWSQKCILQHQCWHLKV